MMRRIQLKTVFLLMSVSFVFARYFTTNQQTNDGNQNDVQSIKLAGNTNADNDNYSRELENLSKSDDPANIDAVLDYSQNIEEDSQAIEENKKSMIVRQLMLMIDNYQIPEDENNLHVRKAVSEVDDILLKDKSKQLKVNNGIPETKSYVDGDRKDMIYDHDNLSKLNPTPRSCPVLNDLSTVQIYTTEKHVESAHSQNKKRNDWSKSKSVKPTAKITEIKAEPKQTFNSNNDLSKKNGIPKHNGNGNKDSSSGVNNSIGKGEIPDGNVTRNEVSKYKIYLSKDTNGPTKIEIRQELAGYKNNTFKVDNDYKSSESNGHNESYQIKREDANEDSNLSYSGSNDLNQTTYDNTSDSDDTLSNNTDVSESKKGENQGKTCTHQCGEDAKFEGDIDESENRNNKGNFTEEKTPMIDTIDEGSSKIILSKNDINKGEENRQYQVKEDTSKNNNNTPMYKASKVENRYHEINFKKQRRNKRIHRKNRYRMI